MNLDSILENNIDILLKLKPEEDLTINDNMLSINSCEEINIENPNTLYSTILNNLFIVLNKKCSLRNKEINLEAVSICIYNIYNNNNLSEDLENNKYFDECFDELYENTQSQINKYIQNNCNRFFYNINESFNLFLRNVISVSKNIIEVQSTINGVSELNSSDSDSEESTSGAESSEENNDNKQD